MSNGSLSLWEQWNEIFRSHSGFWHGQKAKAPLKQLLPGGDGGQCGRDVSIGGGEVSQTFPICCAAIPMGQGERPSRGCVVTIAMEA